eukprot:jgi/Bigna1/143756/aug1.81_g18464
MRTRALQLTLVASAVLSLILIAAGGPSRRVGLPSSIRARNPGTRIIASNPPSIPMKLGNVRSVIGCKREIHKSVKTHASGYGPEYDAFIQKITNPPPLFDSPDQANTVIGAILAATGVSFLGTFVVAPRYAGVLKEDQRWEDIYRELEEGGVQSVDWAEAVKKTNQGRSGVILDVRMENKYATKAIPGSTNIPLYRPIVLDNPVAILRYLGFAFFGVTNSERTPGWLEMVEETVPKNKPVYIVCNSGGSLVNTPGRKFGFESQSLKAVHFLRQAG